MGSEKAGDLTKDQLVEGLSRLLDNKLVNLATEEDLVKLSGRVLCLPMKIGCLKRRLPR